MIVRMNEKVLFPKADASEYQANVSQLQALLLACQQSLYYGLVEISYPSRERIALFFVENKVTCVYSANLGDWTRIPVDEYISLLENAESSVRIVPLPLEGIRIGKVMLECKNTGNTFTIPTSDLKIHLEEWQRLPRITINHVHWIDAEAIFIVPGHRMPIQMALFASQEQVLGGEKALARALAWHELQCEVTTYADEIRTDACLEYHLHLYFTIVLELILKRYDELAGHGLANIVSGALSDMAGKQGWHIQAMDGIVTDNEIFNSHQAAFAAFQTLAGACLSQIETVLGPKLTSTIVEEAIQSIDKTGQEILLQYPILNHKEVIHG